MIVYMALMKELQASGVAALDICFLRSAFGFVHAFSVLKWRGESFYPKVLQENSDVRNALIGRSICGVIAYLCFVFAVARLPLGLVSTIENTSPIWAAIIATIFLKEKLTFFEWTIMACSFSGIIVIFLTAKV
jgi:drug/metabolite transporter (DMT)-like permease